MLSAGQDPEARLAPGTVTLPLCSRPDASPFWIMLLLVWRRSEHGMIAPQRRLPSRFRGRTWRDGGSWQRQHHGDQLGKHHGVVMLCGALVLARLAVEENLFAPDRRKCYCRP